LIKSVKQTSTETMISGTRKSCAINFPEGGCTTGKPRDGSLWGAHDESDM
jgi:hypothetical protein